MQEEEEAEKKGNKDEEEEVERTENEGDAEVRDEDDRDVSYFTFSFFGRKEGRNILCLIEKRICCIMYMFLFAKYPPLSKTFRMKPGEKAR